MTTKEFKLPVPKVNEYLDMADIEDTDLTRLLTADPAYKKQLDNILFIGDGDIEPGFLGFTGTYRHLAYTIPLHWTVVDLGCAYAAQSYYFRKHHKYIGVDQGPVSHRITPPNGVQFCLDIRMWVDSAIRKSEEGEGPVFAICNYMNTDAAAEAARKAYKNIFVYYPDMRRP